MEKDTKPRIEIEVDTTQINEAIKKAKRLVELLQEAEQIVDSLFGGVNKKSNNRIEVDADEIVELLTHQMQEHLSETNKETHYSKEDFLISTKPYDFVNNAKDQSEREKRIRLVCDNAERVGIHNFRKLLTYQSKL